MVLADGVGEAAVGAGAGDGARAGAAAGASPGPATRRFTFSTRTALLRPCEKLCRTVPCSTGRLRCRVAFGGAAPTVLSLLFVSFMPIPIRLALQPIRPARQRSRRRPGAPPLSHEARCPFRLSDKDAN